MTKGSLGYYSPLSEEARLRNPHQLVLVGYSSPVILIGFIFSLCLIVLPLLLGLRRLQGFIVISRSNSLIISAACHISTLRQDHWPSGKLTRMAFDDNTEALGNADEWGHSVTSAISAIAVEHIELQPLVPEPEKTTAPPDCSTTPSQRAHSGALADNITNRETRVSIENSSTINEQIAQPLPPLPPLLTTCKANSNFAPHDSTTLTATVRRRDAGEHPLPSCRPSSESVISDDVGRISIADSDDSPACAGRAGAVDGSPDTESQRLITLAPANSDNGRRAVRSLGADETEDRLQAACSLEEASSSEEDDMQFRLRISRSRIRWGVVRMPDEFYAQFEDLEGGSKVEHLSFGIEQQGVTAPEPGHFYA